MVARTYCREITASVRDPVMKKFVYRRNYVHGLKNQCLILIIIIIIDSVFTLELLIWGFHSLTDGSRPSMITEMCGG